MCAVYKMVVGIGNAEFGSAARDVWRACRSAARRRVDTSGVIGTRREEQKSTVNSHGTFWCELLYLLSFDGALFRRDGRILCYRLRACVAPVLICTIAVVTRAGSRLVVRNGNGIWWVALRPERPQVVLPRVQHDDRLSLSYAVIDRVPVDGHMAHRKWRARRVAHELCDANEGASWCVRGRLHDCMGRNGAQNEQRMWKKEVFAHRQVP